MTKGLVRANNLADLSSKQDSIVNLGLAIADYDSLKSLYTTAGLDFSVVGSIAGSIGNYQAQIDGISSTLSGIVLSGFVNRQGNGLISTSWANSDGIISISGVLSGYPPSSGTTFALSIEQGEAVITASGLSANDLAYNSFRQANSTVVRASPPSGFNTLQLIPLQVGGQSFFVQASETPSFHIAPARMRHALDLVTGNLLGTYNSASPAMAVGPDGILYQPAANAPVIEYDPTTGACLGARIWGAVTNGHINSEDATLWSTPNNITLTANQGTAPNGTLTADRYLETAVNGLHSQEGSVFSFVSGVTYTYSLFVESIGGRNFEIAYPMVIAGASTRFARFNLTTGTVQGADAGITATITAYPNGRFRCAATVTATASASTRVLNLINDESFNRTYAGDTSKGLFIWGAQINPGPLAPYVPTTTLTASSTADVWSITGADFSRIFNATELTIYTEATSQSSADSTIWQIDDNSGNANRFTQYFASNILRSRTTISNSQNDIDRTGVAVGVPARGVYGIKASDYAAVLNGGTIGTSAHALPSATMSILRIGSVHPGGAVMLNGYIRELAIFRSRRPNANLQAMTQ